MDYFTGNLTTIVGVRKGILLGVYQINHSKRALVFKIDDKTCDREDKYGGLDTPAKRGGAKFLRRQHCSLCSPC